MKHCSNAIDVVEHSEDELESSSGDEAEPSEDEAPISSTGRVADVAKTSQVLWGIDWAEWLPRKLTSDGIVICASDIDRALPFISGHYASIFEQDLERSPFFSEPFDGAKMRFYRASDVMEIKDAERTVGVLIAAPSDWSTYYLRSVGVLPEYHGRHLPQRILPLMFEHLARAGVRRFETETSPANLAVLQVMTRMRFNVTGSALTERWGALLRLTKFLDEGAEDVFLDKFCSGIRYQRREQRSKAAI